MDRLGEVLLKNVSVMKSRVTKHAVYGVLIAVSTIILATLLSAQYLYGGVNFENIIAAQKNNFTLWIIDGMPFIFAFWGTICQCVHGPAGEHHGTRPDQ